MANSSERFQHLQRTLSPDQAILLSSPTDLTYFANFLILVPEEREGFLLITQKACYLIKASFSPVPQHHTYRVLEQCRPPALAKHLEEIFTTHQLRYLNLDLSSLFVDEYKAIQEVAQRHHLELLEIEKDTLWQHRMKKDTQEIALMRTAGRYGQQAFQHIFDRLAVGMTEKEVANQVEIELLQLGADKSAFPTIVAFGAHGAEPHYQPGDVPLKKNTAVLIDMGAIVHGYRSDLTRSFWFGDRPEPQFLQVEKIVKDAYTTTFTYLQEHLQETPTAKSLDETARSFIKHHGYEHQFIHTTGHGIGLDIHEPPSLSWSSSQSLLPGMVITIEPGIYLPTQFGFRHENTILIGEKNIEVLTK